MRFVPLALAFALFAGLVSTVLMKIGGEEWINAIMLSSIPAAIVLVVFLIGFVTEIKSVGRIHEDFFNR